MPSPPHDLAALRAHEALGMRLALYPAPGREPGWRPVTDLAEPAIAEASIAAGIACWGGPAAAHGTWLVESLAWQLGTAAALTLLATGTAPPLGPRELHARVNAAGRVEALACAPGPWARGGDPVQDAGDDLAASLAPVIAAVTGLGVRAVVPLWRSAGDGIALAALWAGRALSRPDDGVALAGRLLSPPAPFAVPLRAAPKGAAPLRRRSGCCLAYRVPPGRRCDDCPPVPRASLAR